MIRMVIRTSCITSGSGRIRRSRNSLGLSTWGTAIIQSCTGPARSRRSTAVSSMMRNPPTGRRGLGAFRNRSLTEYIQRNKCRVARSAPTGDKFLHIRCLRVPPCAFGRRFCPISARFLPEGRRKKIIKVWKNHKKGLYCTD